MATTTEGTSSPYLELEVLTLDDFKLYSTVALKQFLCLRKKSTIGSFETLVAR